jgi:hypothetical protein
MKRAMVMASRAMATAATRGDATTDDEMMRRRGDERVDKQMVPHQKGFPLIPRNAECIPFIPR